jgi:hypothetical protein
LKPEELEFSPQDFVTTSVKFSKVGFAQLKSQEFSLPKSWNNITVELSSAKDIARAESGMKLTCGFEMLVSDPQNQDKKVVREIKILLEDVDATEEELPGDVEMAKWSKQDDDETWMDINFNDFEAELAGKESKTKAADDGFGDKSAQDQLRKMVSRFESFMNDEKAGVGGAELDEMDDDDTDDDDDDDTDEDGDEFAHSGGEEDKDVSFDENEFARMMREMMGLPPEDRFIASTKSQLPTLAGSKLQQNDGDDSEDEEIHRVMKQMESELHETGVLNLDPTPKKIAATTPGSKGKQKAVEDDCESEKEHDEEVDIDFTLAKNLLESFQSQYGTAGPAGNLLGLMGVNLPPPDKDEN